MSWALLRFSISQSLYDSLSLSPLVLKALVSWRAMTRKLRRIWVKEILEKLPEDYMVLNRSVAELFLCSSSMIIFSEITKVLLHLL